MVVRSATSLRVAETEKRAASRRFESRRRSARAKIALRASVRGEHQKVAERSRKIGMKRSRYRKHERDYGLGGREKTVSFDCVSMLET